MERSAAVINTLPFNDISQSSYPRVAPKSTAREISFSSYLRPQHSETSFDPPPSRLTQRAVTTADVAELSIFDAEKYFNETAEQRTADSQPPSMERIGEKSDFGRPSSVSSVDGCGRNHKAALFHATPPASSEVSWNSQAGLLSDPPGSMAISNWQIHLSNTKKCPNSPRRWFSRWKCPCSGDKSVDVEEKSYYRQNGHTTNDFASNCTSSNPLRKQNMGGADQEEPAKRPMVRISAEEWTKDESLARGHRALSTEIGLRAAAAGPFSDGSGFTFPILSHQMPTDNALNDPPRQSLEVFRPPLLVAAEEAMMPARNAAAALLHPGDVGRRSFTFATSPRRGEDDGASDSSSDLFEIESFSTSTGGGVALAATMYRRRDLLDELVRSGAGRAPYRYNLDEMSTTITSLGAEAYEPSEASVEWSVVTAEGFDRGSVANFSASASEFGETRLAELPEVGERAVTMLGAGVFLSCRCEKAVSVGPQSVKQPGAGPVGHSTLSTNRHHHHRQYYDEVVDDDDDNDTSIIHINNNNNTKKKMPTELGREASLMASLAVHGGGRPLHVNTKPRLPRSNSARLGARPFIPR